MFGLGGWKASWGARKPYFRVISLIFAKNGILALRYYNRVGIDACTRHRLPVMVMLS
jgi:hypothetical protein